MLRPGVPLRYYRLSEYVQQNPQTKWSSDFGHGEQGLPFSRIFPLARSAALVRRRWNVFSLPETVPCGWKSVIDKCDADTLRSLWMIPTTFSKLKVEKASAGPTCFLRRRSTWSDSTDEANQPTMKVIYDKSPLLWFFKSLDYGKWDNLADHA